MNNTVRRQVRATKRVAEIKNCGVAKAVCLLVIVTAEVPVRIVWPHVVGCERVNSAGGVGGEDHPNLTFDNVSKSTEPYEEGNTELSIWAEGAIDKN